jgi:hypothetical protein
MGFDPVENRTRGRLEAVIPINISTKGAKENLKDTIKKKVKFKYY